MSLFKDLKEEKISKIESLYVFIDSSNIWAAQKSKKMLGSKDFSWGVFETNIIV